MHPVTTAPSTAPLTPRIKWSRVSKEKEVVLLVATEGQVRVNSIYQDKVSLPNYPAIPSDATLEIQNLRSNDSGIYRCEVMHGIEDSEATLEVIVKGEGPPTGGTMLPVERARMMSSAVGTFGDQLSYSVPLHTRFLLIVPYCRIAWQMLFSVGWDSRSGAHEYILVLAACLPTIFQLSGISVFLASVIRDLTGVHMREEGITLAHSLRAYSPPW